MQAVKFWYQYTVHCKKAVALFLLLILFQRTQAQYNVYEHDVRFEQRHFHFGISNASIDFHILDLDLPTFEQIPNFL